MNRLRSRWGKRWVAALLAASLLPVSFATVAEAAQHTPSFADWVRAQLREPADDAVAQALAEAEASSARSLEAFLAAFVEAFEAQQPDASLAHAFSALDLSNEALVSYLQSRFLGFVGNAVLPRLAFQAVQAAPSHVAQRGATPLATLARRDLTHRTWTTTRRQAAAPVSVYSLRRCCAAQPRGP